MLEQNRALSQPIARTNRTVEAVESKKNTNHYRPSISSMDQLHCYQLPVTALKNPFRPPIPLVLQADFFTCKEKKGSMMQKDLDAASEYVNELRRIFSYLRAHKWELGALGILGVVVHFWRVGHLPQLTFMDIGLLAAAIAAFTLLAILFFVFVVFSPSLALIAWSNQQAICRPPTPAVRARAVRRWNRVCPCCNNPVHKRSKAGDPTQRAMGFALLFPFLGFLTALGLLWGTSLLPEEWSTYALGLFLIACTATLLASLIASRPATGSERRKRRRWRWVKYYVRCVALYGIVIPIAGLTASVLVQAFRDGDDLAKISFLLTLPAIHCFIFSIYRHERKDQYFLWFFIALYTILATGIVFDANDMAASRFKMGMLRNQQMVVTPVGCEIAKASNIVETCTHLTNSREPLMLISDVQILTRMGSNFIIASPTWTVGKRGQSAPIPATEVRSWFAAPEKASDSPAITPAAAGPN